MKKDQILTLLVMQLFAVTDLGNGKAMVITILLLFCILLYKEHKGED